MSGFRCRCERRVRYDSLAPAKTCRRGLTLIEVLVVVVVIGFVIALLLPMLQAPATVARRMVCSNQLKQIGLALHNYTQANKAFPPGTICENAPTQPGNQYDVWGEAGSMDKGKQGTSFLLLILPYLEQDQLFRQWEPQKSVAGNAGDATHPGAAVTDIRGFYCPTHRGGDSGGLRPEDHKMMLAEWWPGGGTDYGGCAGRHAAFSLTTGYNLCDVTMTYGSSFQPHLSAGVTDEPKRRWGIFGQVNVGTKFGEISDGTPNTIMLGELQRITDLSPGSKDGWAIGGPATLFTTGAMFRRNGDKLINVANRSGKLLNNSFFGSPGSDHPGGANFGMADGSVRFISDDIDPTVFALMGSMADGQEIKLD